MLIKWILIPAPQTRVLISLTLPQLCSFREELYMPQLFNRSISVHFNSEVGNERVRIYIQKAVGMSRSDCWIAIARDAQHGAPTRDQAQMCDRVPLASVFKILMGSASVLKNWITLFQKLIGRHYENIDSLLITIS